MKKSLYKISSLERFTSESEGFSILEAQWHAVNLLWNSIRTTSGDDVNFERGRLLMCNAPFKHDD